ncbi:MAG: putative protein of unknown function zinc metallopeptidase [Marmoricola sp.]|nr:putative protein of unknown function zinc metallopeptidase [Marmoricola sp.]
MRSRASLASLLIALTALVPSHLVHAQPTYTDNVSLAVALSDPPPLEPNGPEDTIPAAASAEQAPAAPTGVDPIAASTQLITFVVQDADRMWTSYFAANNLPEPTVQYAIIQDGQPFLDSCSRAYIYTNTPNAYYCKDNDTIELPVSTMADVLQGKLIGKPYDPKLTNFTIALIVAHEFGHSVHEELMKNHVPMLVPLGRRPDNPANAAHAELFADCAAGIWARHAYVSGYLQQGDLDAGLETMSQLGDPPGTASLAPHGSPAQRVGAYNYGLNTGQPAWCMNYYLGVPLKGQ